MYIYICIYIYIYIYIYTYIYIYRTGHIAQFVHEVVVYPETLLIHCPGHVTLKGTNTQHSGHMGQQFSN